MNGTANTIAGAIAAAAATRANLNAAEEKALTEQPAPVEEPAPTPPVSAEHRARMAEAAIYKFRDLHQLHMSGAIEMHPLGTRVLLRAILPQDAVVVGEGVGYDARQAIAHVVEAVGSGVRRHLDMVGVDDDAREPDTLRKWLRRLWQGRGRSAYARPMRGDHLYLLSTAADRASKTDRTCRLWYAHCDDLSGAWSVPLPVEDPAPPESPSHPPAADPH